MHPVIGQICRGMSLKSLYVVYVTDCTLAPDKESIYVHVMLLLL